MLRHVRSAVGTNLLESKEHPMSAAREPPEGRRGSAGSSTGATLTQRPVGSLRHVASLLEALWSAISWPSGSRTNADNPPASTRRTSDPILVNASIASPMFAMHSPKHTFDVWLIEVGYSSMTTFPRLKE